LVDETGKVLSDIVIGIKKVIDVVAEIGAVSAGGFMGTKSGAWPYATRSHSARPEQPASTA